MSMKQSLHFNYRPWFLFLGLFLVLQSISAQEVGMNLGSPNSGLVFVDLVKATRGFQAIDRDSQTGRALVADLDENSWPREDFQLVCFDLSNARGNGTNGFVQQDPEPPFIDVNGLYLASFKGKAGTITVEGSRNQPTNIRYDAGSNTTFFELEYSSIVDGQPLLILQMTETKRNASALLNSGITDLKIIRPGYDLETEQVFTDVWLNAIAPFKTLRYMDWAVTNNSATFSNQSVQQGPIEIDWDNELRNTPEDATTGSFRFNAPFVGGNWGLPWETIVAHSNTTNTNMWISVPVNASDDYVRNLAQLLRSSLPNTTKVYLEYSNEIWNLGFSQYQWNLQKAQQEAASADVLDFDGTTNQELIAARRVANRTVEIEQIFVSEGFTNGVNVFPVLGAYASRAGQNAAGTSINATREMLNFIESTYGPPANYIYAIMENGYFGGREINSLPEGASVSQILDKAKEGLSLNYPDYQNLADDFAIKFVLYEGAPGYVVNSARNLQNRITAERTETMSQLLAQNIIDGYGGVAGEDGLFMYFASHKFYDASGFWGFTDNIQNLDTFKYQALQNVINRTNLDPKPVIYEQALGAAAVGQFYNQEILVGGGNAPLTLQLEGGILPEGLDFNGSRLTGTPAVGGVYRFTLGVADADGDTYSKDFILNVTSQIDVPKTSLAPIIDGNVDPLWESVVGYNLPNVIRGSIVQASDFSAFYKVAWDELNLYTLITVKDESLVNDSEFRFEDDGVEIYIDAGNEKAERYDDNDYQTVYRFDDPEVEINGSTINTLEIVREQVTTPDGYQVEVAIPWEKLGRVPSDGLVFGLEIHAADDDDGGSRDTKISFNAPEDISFNTPSSFGVAKLVDGLVTVEEACLPSGLSASNITQNEAVLNWNVIQTVRTYSIRLREQGATVWNELGDYAVNRFELDGLRSDTTYEWSVRATCETGTSDYVETQTFQTLGNPHIPDSNSITLEAPLAGFIGNDLPMSIPYGLVERGQLRVVLTNTDTEATVVESLQDLDPGTNVEEIVLALPDGLTPGTFYSLTAELLNESGTEVLVAFEKNNFEIREPLPLNTIEVTLPQSAKQGETVVLDVFYNAEQEGPLRVLLISGTSGNQGIDIQNVTPGAGVTRLEVTVPETVAPGLDYTLLVQFFGPNFQGVLDAKGVADFEVISVVTLPPNTIDVVFPASAAQGDAISLNVSYNAGESGPLRLLFIDDDTGTRLGEAIAEVQGVGVANLSVTVPEDARVGGDYTLLVQLFGPNFQGVLDAKGKNNFEVTKDTSNTIDATLPVSAVQGDTITVSVTYNSDEMAPLRLTLIDNATGDKLVTEIEEVVGEGSTELTVVVPVEAAPGNGYTLLVQLFGPGFEGVNDTRGVPDFEVLPRSVPVANLLLTSLCSENPDLTRSWRVRNPNDFDVPVRWEVFGTDQTGELVAIPGDSFFETTTIEGANTTKIFWTDENEVERSTVKASGGVECEKPTVYFLIKNKKLGEYLRPETGNIEARIIVAANDGSDWFQWEKVMTDNDYFILRNKKTGKPFRPETNSNGSRVLQKSINSTGRWVQWKTLPTGAGNFVYLLNRRTAKFTRPLNATQKQLVLRPTGFRGDWTQYVFEPAEPTSATSLLSDIDSSRIVPSIYPNPIKDVFILENRNYEGIFYIYDMAGRLVVQGELRKNQARAINIMELPSGVYSLRMGEYNFKLLKE